MSNLDLAGYHLTFDQEFTNPAGFTPTPDGSAGFKTQYDWGGRTVPNNKEAEFYSDPSIGVNPFSVQSGELTITAQPSIPGERSDGMPYTSGMITTQTSFSQHGGYFEMRAEVPGGQGLWPAFWMLPTTGDYPEMDIMEDPNLGPTDQYWLHATAPSGGGGGYVQGGTPLASGYHTYGALWTDQTITFYFDQRAIAEVSTPAAFATLKMYMIADLAIGGVDSWPATPGPGSIPAQLKIDYIRAYSNNAADPAVAMQAISSPDGANTTPVLTEVPLPQVTNGSGPDTLVLHMAEDYYQGDAQFTVSIDGVPQGGTFTTIAANARGQTQDFAFKGSFAPGSHTVAVDFLNDSYGGNSYLDRNLYVQSGSIDGQAISNSTLAEITPGSQSFTFQEPSAVTPNIKYMDTATNSAGTASAAPYTGPVSGLQGEYVWAGNDSVNIVGKSPNLFLHSGGGNDALSTTSGSNVLDGGTGSNFLAGATGADGGQDTFFTDARNSSIPVWNTVSNFHSGDNLTLWGFTGGVSTESWADNQGAAGYQGATLHSETAGAGTGVNASVTLVGFTTGDIAARTTISTGSTGGNNYLSIHYN